MAPKRGKRRPGTDDLLGSDFAQRKVQREIEICAIAKQTLERCNYRRGKKQIESVVPGARHGVVGLRVREASAIFLYLASPMRWFDEVYRKGLACVSGSIVLQIEKDLEDGSLIVLAVKQARGCTLKLVYGLVHKQRHSWILEFNSLPPEFSNPPSNPKHDAVGPYYEEVQRRRAAAALEGLLSGTRR